MFYRKKTRQQPHVQMAPLIDVVFLLLIFFMVATVFPENEGISIEKPEADTAKALPDEHLMFTITKDGDEYYNGAKITLEESASIIKNSVRAKPDIPVIVKIDRRSVTGKLVEFLDSSRKAGAKNIAVAADPGGKG